MQDSPALASFIDPVVEHYKQFVDREELRANLRLTPAHRIEKMQQRAAAFDAEVRKNQPAVHAHPVWAPISDCGPDRTTDPVVELFKAEVDRTLLRENLRLTPDQRLRNLASFSQFLDEMRGAVRRSRGAE